MPNSPLKPKIYIPGKMSNENFRETLIPELGLHQWGDVNIETDSFIYLGPYTVKDELGWFNGNGTHGCIGDDGVISVSKKEVINKCMGAVAEADIVLAFIESIDCPGTIHEIATALCAKKRVVICFSPEAPVNEFWFSSEQAATVHFGINICCLKQVLQNEIANYGKN